MIPSLSLLQLLPGTPPPLYLSTLPQSSLISLVYDSYFALASFISIIRSTNPNE